MSYRELIDALNKEGEEKARKIWQEAEAEAASIRSETERAKGELQEKRKHELLSDSALCSETILGEARQKARTVRLEAEKALAERLYRLILSSLKDLRDERYSDTFSALAAEIPHHEWQEVRVNPADAGIARSHFPGAAVIPDPSVTGGLEVKGQSGRICVNNSLEKRVEKAWPEIVPDLVKDVYRSIDGGWQA